MEPPECEEPIDNDEEARLVAQRASSSRRYSNEEDEESSGDEWGDKYTNKTQSNTSVVHRKEKILKGSIGRPIPLTEIVPSVWLPRNI